MVYVNLVFDFSNIYHKSYFVCQSMKKDFSLKNQNDRAILLRKVLTDICACVRLFGDKYQIYNVFVCFDDYPFRRRIDSSYKANRVSKEKEFYEISDEVFKILQSQKINAVKITELEADDLLQMISTETHKHLAEVPEHERDNIVYSILVTADEDAHQLLNRFTVVYNNNSQKRRLYISDALDQSCGDWDWFRNTLFEVKEKIEIEEKNPFLVLCEKIILGCQGDEVQRLVPKGIGSAAIKKAVARQGAMEYQIQEGLNGVNALVLLIMNILTNSFGIKLPYQAVHHRLRLVCLNNNLYPENSIVQYEEFKFHSLNVEEWKMQHLLKDTKYIHFI